MARPSAPQQAVARGKTILSDHSANQGTERSAGATPSHGVGGAAASTVTGKLIKLIGIFVKHLQGGFQLSKTKTKPSTFQLDYSVNLKP